MTNHIDVYELSRRLLDAENEIDEQNIIKDYLSEIGISQSEISKTISFLNDVDNIYYIKDVDELSGFVDCFLRNM